MACAAALCFCSFCSSSSERCSSCCMEASALRCSTLICRCFGGTAASVRSPPMIARLAALLCLLALAAPGAALAQGGGAFDPIPQAPPPPPPTQPSDDDPTDDEEDGLSPNQQL